MRFIPTVRAPFPDELFYSYMGRLAVMNGVDIENFSGMFLGIRDVNKDTLPPDGRTAFVQLYKHLPFPGDMAETYLGLTTFAFEAMALTPGQQTKYINSVMRPESALNPPAPSMFPKIMVCPECAKEDIEKYGTMYYHRVHHLPGVKVCPRHHVHLLYRAASAKVLDFDIASFKPLMKLKKEAGAYADYAYAVHKAGISTDALALQDVFVRRYEELGYNVSASLLPPVRDLNEWRHSAIIENSSDEPSVRVTLSDAFCMDAEGIITLAMRLYPDPNDFIATLSGHGPLLETHTCPVCGEVYCATPQSLHDGWGCPSCTQDVSDEDMFARITMARGYEPLEQFTSLDKPVDLKHFCGNVITVTPEHFLYGGARCDCTETSSVSEGAGYPATVPAVYDWSQAAVVATRDKGGPSVECVYLRFQGPKEIPNNNNVRYTQETFEAAVKDLVGDEYVVTGKYLGKRKPIEILHTKCGGIHKYNSAESFLRGQRCPDCGASAAFCSLEEKLDEYSKGRCILLKAVHGYEVIDTLTGKGVILTARKLLREMGRPNASPYLPVSNGKGWKPYWDRMYFLLLDYQAGNGTVRPPAGLWYKGYPLGPWANSQLESLKNALLDDEKTVLLKYAGIQPYPHTLANSLPASVNWERRFDQYIRYVRSTGSASVPRGTIFEGESIDIWIANQRKKFKNGVLPKEQADKLLSVDPDIFKNVVSRPVNGLTREEMWNRRFSQYERYVEETGAADISSKDVYEGEYLGAWILNQKKKYQNGELDEDRAEKLLQINPHVFDLGPRDETAFMSFEEKWDYHFALYERYIKETRMAYIPVDTVYNGCLLGEWVDHQRKHQKEGVLSEDRAARLLTINPDIFRHSGRWALHYRQYERYIKETGETHIPCHALYDGYDLGHWVYLQRYQWIKGELSDERKEDLLKLDPDFLSVKDFHDNEWQRKLLAYSQCVEENGDPYVRDDKEYLGIMIGRWANKQRRQERKGSLSPERKAMLLEVDPDFFDDKVFHERMVEHLPKHDK